MASRLLSLVTSSPSQAFRDDEFIERLHHRHTVTVLLVCAVIVAGQIYIFGSPIVCWTPAEFKGGWNKYTNSYCWVQNTYYLPVEERVPRPHEARRELLYYQWTPFVFIAMAVLYYGPCVLWHALNSKSGIDADDILRSARVYSKVVQHEQRVKALALIVHQLDRFLGSVRRRDDISISWRRTVLKKLGVSGNFMLILYLIVKLLYIGNTLGQLFVLNSVLSVDYHLYGIQLIQDALHGRPLTETAYLNNSIFPKVTMCDFEIRRLGNSHRYTVQCLLPINMYTENIFIFLWFWMVFILLLSLMGLVVWLLRFLLPNDKIVYLENHLQAEGRLGGPTGSDLHVIKDFQSGYLHQDGVLLLRMISHNTNTITANDIIVALWDYWLERHRHPGPLGGLMYPPLANDQSQPIMIIGNPNPYFLDLDLDGSRERGKVQVLPRTHPGSSLPTCSESSSLHSPQAGDIGEGGTISKADLENLYKNQIH